MTLTDVMSGSGLAIYAEIALVIFVSIFALVLASISKKNDGAAWEHAKSLPLDMAEGEEQTHACAEDR